MGDRTDLDESGRTLASLIRQERKRILEDAARGIVEMPPAKGADHKQLIDRLPPVVDRIAEMVELRLRGEEPERPEEAGVHAVDRLSEGFGLEELVSEYGLLRESILRATEEQAGDDFRIEPAVVRALNQAVDEAVRVSVATFVSERERTNRALDALAEVAFGSRTLDELLDRLLRVLAKNTRDAEILGISLLEEDDLVVRAATGAEADAWIGSRSPVGEGFAGRIAKTRQEWSVSSVADSAIVKDEFLRRVGIHALVGVPLLHDDEVVAVAEMGSRKKREFSPQDVRIFRAMTKRATAAIVQQRLRDEATAKAKEAREAVHQRDELLAIVSHDLRQPLATVALATRHLRSTVEDEVPAAVRTLERIERASRHMEELIDDLLDTAAIQRGKLPLSRRREDIASLLEEAVSLHEPIFQDRSIELSLDLDGAEELFVHADRERVLQVLSNLLGNSARFCTSGDRVELRARKDGDRVAVEVRDTGPGFPSEMLPRAFDAFKPGAKRGDGGGTGLGLFIARGIVESHGGRIEAENAERGGARVRFTLPRA